MSKFDYGKLFWFGPPPATPEPKPYLLGWNPALSRFKPFGLPVKDLARASTVDDEFAAEIKAMMKTVPPAIAAILQKFGTAVIPVRDAYDMSLWLGWNGPRGHSKGRMAWAEVSGFCSFDTHLIVITRNATMKEVYIKCDNRQGVFNHEVGHVLDVALDLISQSRDFLTAVASDIEQLDPISRLMYRYLLQSLPTGPSEIFAECYASTQGGCAVKSWTEDMPVYFPNSYRFVKELVENLSLKHSVEGDNQCS